MADNVIRYAGFPTAVMYKQPVARKRVGKEPCQHLLWGDWLKLTGNQQSGWVEVFGRKARGWVHQDFLQQQPLLRITFVDIGQGDGCLVSTPADQHILVDAGEGDNMFRFLRWKFGRFRKPFRFEAAIISHPDSDHYRGFDMLFDEPNVSFGTVYHNGIVERKAASATQSLGRLVAAGGQRFLMEVVPDHAGLVNLLNQPAKIAGKQYAVMLKKALDAGRVGAFRMLSVADGYLPGYGPNDPLQIQVLGPVVEPTAAGEPRLRWFGDPGKTKNGHSVVLRLKYGHVSVLLGGDLNIPAEHHLLAHHTGLPTPPAEDQEALFLRASRKVFESDVAKACHHGSADFSDLFLRSVNPIATVISSGDDEAYSHPRADSLGAVGRHSRGTRPLIFSTELARSAKETVKHPSVLRQQLRELEKAVEDASTAAAKEKARAKLDRFHTQVLDRSIAVYGAINVCTDGTRVVIAQKIEQPRALDKKWDFYTLEPDDSGDLRFVSKYQGVS
jgi:beta-lactamase superfamily II metal-dependent hydrolase